MTSRTPALTELLPGLYRGLDKTGHLHALGAVIDSARARIERDIAALYDDWFVETCGDDMLPRLAQLSGSDGPPHDAPDGRALVARRTAFDRARGTAQAAAAHIRTLTGWPVALTANAAQGRAIARVSQGRLCTFRMTSPAPAIDAHEPGCFRLHPLGIDTPLFGFDDDGIPYRLRAHAEAAQRSSDVCIMVRDATGPWRELGLVFGALASWGERLPVGIDALVDPERGRLRLSAAMADRAECDIAVSCTTTQILPPRSDGPNNPPMASSERWVACVHRAATTGVRDQTNWFATLDAALAAAAAVASDVHIRLFGSSAHTLGHGLVTDRKPVCPDHPNRPRRVVIEGRCGESPVVRGTLLASAHERGLLLTLRGLIVDGTLALSGDVEADVDGCLVMRVHDQARPALMLKAAHGASPRLTMRGSATGPIRGDRDATITLSDTVVDGCDAAIAVDNAARLVTHRSTILGPVVAVDVEANDSLLTGPIEAIGPGAPRISHCLLPYTGEPAVEAVGCRFFDDPAAALHSTTLGDPGYAVPRRDGAAAGGARNDGGDIGATNRAGRIARERLAEACRSELTAPGIDLEFEFFA